MAIGKENTPDVSGTAHGARAFRVTDRLDDQIGWYDRKSASNKRWYYRLKVLQIVVAAAIPVIQIMIVSDEQRAATGIALLVGAMGALIVVVEGFQQLFQVHNTWTAYRSTCEALKHEKFLYEAHAGPYATATMPDALLAERIEGLVSQEHAAWVSEQRDAERDASPP